MARPEPLQQLTVSLPGTLVDFIQRQAVQQDRTLGGAIRHLISQAARLEILSPPPFDVLPNVGWTAESIAENRTRLANLQRELAQIAPRARSKTDAAPAADDGRRARILAEIEWLTKGIAMAERMTKPSNGG